jgi:hypothetical protein
VAHGGREGGGGGRRRRHGWHGRRDLGGAEVRRGLWREGSLIWIKRREWDIKK